MSYRRPPDGGESFGVPPSATAELLPGGRTIVVWLTRAITLGLPNDLGLGLGGLGLDAHHVYDPDTSTIFQLHRPFLTEAEAAELADRYRSGISWGDAKGLLDDAMEARLAEPRARYEELLAKPEVVEEALRDGAARARVEAAATLAACRRAVGID